jgi:hypothetical protein
MLDSRFPDQLVAQVEAFQGSRRFMRKTCYSSLMAVENSIF